MTYCQEKLPVMPSLRRSRKDRCRLGPEPVSGGRMGFSPSSITVAMFDADVEMGAPGACSMIGGCWWWYWWWCGDPGDPVT